MVILKVHITVYVMTMALMRMKHGTWFLTQQQVKIWRDDDEYCDDEKVR